MIRFLLFFVTLGGCGLFGSDLPLVEVDDLLPLDMGENLSWRDHEFNQLSEDFGSPQGACGSFDSVPIIVGMVAMIVPENSAITVLCVCDHAVGPAHVNRIGELYCADNHQTLMWVEQTPFEMDNPFRDPVPSTFGGATKSCR